MNDLVRGLRTRFYFLRGLRTRNYSLRRGFRTRIYFLGAPFGATRTPDAGRDRDAAKQHKNRVAPQGAHINIPRASARVLFRAIRVRQPVSKTNRVRSPCTLIILNSSFFILHFPVAFTPRNVIEYYTYNNRAYKTL